LNGWLEQLDNESDPDQYEKLLQTMFADLSSDEIASALTLLRADHRESADKLSRRLFRHWAETDLAAAAGYFAQMPSGPLRVQALDDVAILKADADLSEAAKWANQMPDDADKQRSLGGIANEAVRTDPVVEIGIALDLPPGTARDDLLCRSATEWAAHDPQSAIDWIRKISDATVRNKILATAVTACGDSYPVAAATVAVNELPESRERSDALVGIAQRWAERNPQHAAAWVEQFPDGELRSAAIENVAMLWWQTDELQAGQWLNALNSAQRND